VRFWSPAAQFLLETPESRAQILRTAAARARQEDFLFARRRSGLNSSGNARTRMPRAINNQ
jgi:hypothetical protein